MRRPALLLAFMAAACSAGPEPAAVAAGEPVACAHAGSDWTTTCRLERTVEGGHELLVIRRADGAFRRLVVRGDGSGLAPADGAAPLVERRQGAMIEVSLGDDRYRLPLALGAAR